MEMPGETSVVTISSCLPSHGFSFLFLFFFFLILIYDGY